MKTLVIALVLAATLLAPGARACDSHGSTFILREDANTTRLIGSMDDLSSLRSKFKGHGSPAMWVRIDGKEYVIDDAGVINRAREIFTRDEPFTVKQEALDHELAALERRQDALDDDDEAEASARAKLEVEERALDRRQDELDAALDRVSEQIERDLESLAREAIRIGKAR